MNITSSCNLYVLNFNLAALIPNSEKNYSLPGQISELKEKFVKLEPLEQRILLDAKLYKLEKQKKHCDPCNGSAMQDLCNQIVDVDRKLAVLQFKEGVEKSKKIGTYTEFQTKQVAAVESQERSTDSTEFQAKQTKLHSFNCGKNLSSIFQTLADGLLDGADRSKTTTLHACLINTGQFNFIHLTPDQMPWQDIKDFCKLQANVEGVERVKMLPTIEKNECDLTEDQKKAAGVEEYCKGDDRLQGKVGGYTKENIAQTTQRRFNAFVRTYLAAREKLTPKVPETIDEKPPEKPVGPGIQPSGIEHTPRTPKEIEVARNNAAQELANARIILNRLEQELKKLESSVKCLSSYDPSLIETAQSRMNKQKIKVNKLVETVKELNDAFKAQKTEKALEAQQNI